jgi:hypothetical protein
VFETETCQLATGNMVETNSGNNSVYSDTVIVVVKQASACLMCHIFSQDKTKIIAHIEETVKTLKYKKCSA